MHSVSIIIPAHDEAAVIGRLLDGLIPVAESIGFQIIVICNACSDNTAEIVTGYPAVELIETHIPSKTNALNLGDSRAEGSVRVYMDADIVMSAEHVRTLIEALNDTTVKVAVPRIQMNFSHCSWYVKAYYDVWLSLPYVKEGIMGGGVYALSPEGRKKFDTFPDVISDDGFVMGHFSEAETKCVRESVSLVAPPRTLAGLIKIKIRSRYGLYQLFEVFPEMRSKHAKNYGSPVLDQIRSPASWGKMLIYLGVNLYCKYRAKKLLSSGLAYRWETDTSSRL